MTNIEMLIILMLGAVCSVLALKLAGCWAKKRLTGQPCQTQEEWERELK